MRLPSTPLLLAAIERTMAKWSASREDVEQVAEQLMEHFDLDEAGVCAALDNLVT